MKKLLFKLQIAFKNRQADRRLKNHPDIDKQAEEHVYQFMSRSQSTCEEITRQLDEVTEYINDSRNKI